MKNYLFLSILVISGTSLAFAQMMGGGYYVSPSPVVSSTGGGSAAGLSATASATAGTSIAYPTIVQPAPPVQTNDIVQFDNLTIQNVSSQTLPSEITAGYTVYPMTGGTSGGTMAPKAPSSAPTATPPQIYCKRFYNLQSGQSTSIPCPVVNVSSTSVSPNLYPYPGGYSYRIEVDQNTRLFLRDRTSAALADFSVGDQINVYGFYNANGSIQALVVRDMSKPKQMQFVQINNAQVVSVSGTAAPAQITVIQEPSYPCYGYGASGTQKQLNFPCPMGAQLNTPASGTVPQSLMPEWIASRKYLINIDSNTILLNRVHTQISLSDIKIGDKLNIYGGTDTTGATIDADIVRDISQPPTTQNLEGRVIQVNADGSFVIQTANGSTYTVQNPIQVGAQVKISGLIDEINKTISQITNLMVNNQNQYPTPVPLPYLRIQGVTTTPSKGGAPTPTQ